MGAMAALPTLQLDVPSDLRYRGRWVDNEFSNMLLLKNGRSMAEFGCEYRESENLFVACKSNNPHDWRHLSTIGASAAKKYGRGLALRPDWEVVCIAAMGFAIWHKYRPMTPEADMLIRLHRSQELIVEWNNWADRRWGCAFGRGERIATGKNVLGYLLELRGAELCGEISELVDWEACGWDLRSPTNLGYIQDDLIRDILRVQKFGKASASEWRVAHALR